MLTQLTIHNFGLIEKLSLQYDPHLTILTGETGAGKSILIEALRSVLGDRISADQVRDPKSPCIIEAVFHLTDKELRSREVFEDFLTGGEEELIIQRQYLPDGKNKIKINGLTVTVAQLREVGNFLVDFHGPHDHQMLLSSSAHGGMLDRLIRFGSTMDAYAGAYKTYAELQRQLTALHDIAASRERELDLVTHQVKELGAVPLDQVSYDALLQQRSRANNAQRLSEAVEQLCGLLDGDMNSPSEAIRQSFSPMRLLNQLDAQTSSFANALENLQEVHQELVATLRSYAEGLSFQPQEAAEINERFDRYDDILRKYGPTLSDAQAFYVQAKEKYDVLVNYEQEDSELKKKVATAEKEVTSLAAEITALRKKAAKALKKTIEKELSELGILHVQFEARVEKTPVSERGVDLVTFFISPNAGEELKPLADIVSSGEAARVMLALKKALIDVDPIPVLIFDEIDAQIGGRLGSIIGGKLREIGQKRQVILITHLPQIASFADVHYKVCKSVKDGRALTNVELLGKEARVAELAKMMSGEQETEIARKHAKDMLVKARG